MKPMTNEEMAERCDEWAEGMPNDADLAAEFTAIARRIRLLDAEVKVQREVSAFWLDETGCPCPSVAVDYYAACGKLTAARAALDADERGEVKHGN